MSGVLDWLEAKGVIAWLESTPINAFMLDTPWAVPAAETLHFMGLTLLLGSLLVVDLRGLGMLRMIPFEQAHKLIALAILGFAINAVTGTAFLFFDPSRYFANVGFLYKLVLILLAGINALVFELLVFRKVRAGDMSAQESMVAKVTSGLSLVFWFTVLVLGRFMPYVEY